MSILGMFSIVSCHLLYCQGLIELASSGHFCQADMSLVVVAAGKRPLALILHIGRSLGA